MIIVAIKIFTFMSSASISVHLGKIIIYNLMNKCLICFDNGT